MTITNGTRTKHAIINYAKITIIFLTMLSSPDSSRTLISQNGNASNQNEADDYMDSGATCHLREIEICLVGVGSFLQNSNGIPVTKVEIDRQCELFEESTECFVKYGERCTTKGHNWIIGLFSGSMFDIQRDFCNRNSQLHADYMKHAKCLRSIQKKYQNECLTQFQVAFEPIHKIGLDKRHPLACCNFKRLKSCFGKPLIEECGEDAHKLVERAIERSLGTRICLHCRKYEAASDECKSILPSLDAQPHYGKNTSALSRVISTYNRIRII